MGFASISRRSPLYVGLALLAVILAGGLAHLANFPIRRTIGKLVAGFSLAHPVAINAASAPILPTQIGVDLTGVNYWSGERAFSNLAMGSGWNSGVNGRQFHEVGANQIDADGVPVGLPKGLDLFRMITTRAAGDPKAQFRCTHDGAGIVSVNGGATEAFTKPASVTFRWPDRNIGIWLIVTGLDSANPLRNLDCRETSIPRDQRFDPAYVAWLKGFRLLRFMDWQQVNSNQPMTWATRPTTTAIDGSRGIAVEDMVLLSNQVGADAWFNMPWAADDDYIEKFARYVHDHLDRERKIYLETGNEVWNFGFNVAGQAQREGLGRKLADNPYEAQMRRYAQRTIEVMKIWERVFADHPGRLIRIVSTQHVNPTSAEIVLAFPGLAAHIDALATAPYFAYDQDAGGKTGDLTEIFRRIDVGIDATLAQAAQNKALAARYGKRYIAYEAGQHITMSDTALEARIQRDPRMYSAYKRYIGLWRERIGDTMSLFASTAPIGAGAWGLVEYSGQPIADAPKLRAAVEERAR